MEVKIDITRIELSKKRDRVGNPPFLVKTHSLSTEPDIMLWPLDLPHFIRDAQAGEVIVHCGTTGKGIGGEFRYKRRPLLKAASENDEKVDAECRKIEIDVTKMILKKSSARVDEPFRVKLNPNSQEPDIKVWSNDMAGFIHEAQSGSVSVSPQKPYGCTDVNSELGIELLYKPKPLSKPSSL